VDTSSGAAGCAGTPKPATQTLTLTADTPGSYAVHVDLRTSTGASLAPVVLDVAVEP
jgi:hypothetical protein